MFDRCEICGNNKSRSIATRCKSCAHKNNKHSLGRAPWNKGRSKLTDERIINYALKCSETKKGNVPWNKGQTYEELRGKTWSDSFIDGIRNTKKGVPSKRRGLKIKTDTFVSISKFKLYIRKSIGCKLKITWQNEIRKRDRDRCVLCGKTVNLEIHHLRKLSYIINLVMKRNDFDVNKFKEYEYEKSFLEKIINEIVAEHKIEDGMLVCNKCHIRIDKERRKWAVKRGETSE